MMTDQMTLAERLAFHKKAFAPVNRDLEHGIAHHMQIARFSQKEHIKRYHVQVARIQNRWLLSNRRCLRNMGQEQPRTIPKRKPYVPKRPGETGYAEKAQPHALTPLAVAVAAPEYAPEPLGDIEIPKALSLVMFHVPGEPAPTRCNAIVDFDSVVVRRDGEQLTGITVTIKRGNDVYPGIEYGYGEGQWCWWREWFCRKLAHDRAIAPTPTPLMLKEYALDLVRGAVNAGVDPVERFANGGGSGPARDGKPAYGYGGGIHDDRGNFVRLPRRGELVVELGERGVNRIQGVFKIAELVREVRSGAVQLDMFGGAL
jgi:hypothetical protein